MAKIIFKDVGRGKWNGEITIPDKCDADEIAEHAYNEATKHLRSRFPDVSYDPNNNKGQIESGYHIAGTFTVEN